MNSSKVINFFSFKDSLELGQKLFLLGIFFLPSALPIGGFFLLISIIIAFSFYKEEIKTSFTKGKSIEFLSEQFKCTRLTIIRILKI